MRRTATRRKLNVLLITVSGVGWDRLGIELCDHDNDPHDFHDLAEDPLYAGVRKDLRTLLRRVQKG